MIILKRDGAEVLRGDWFSVYKYIHNSHSYSVSHALNYEGYSVEEVA
jgi:hypothetical protein